jgi:hypothetical protein
VLYLPMLEPQYEYWLQPLYNVNERPGSFARYVSYKFPIHCPDMYGLRMMDHIEHP